MHLHWTDEHRAEYERVRKLLGEEVGDPFIHNMLCLIGEGQLPTEQALAFTLRHLALSNAGLMRDITALAMARPFHGLGIVNLKTEAEQTDDQVARWTEAATDTLKRCNTLLKVLRSNGDLTGNRQELDRLIGNTAMLRDGEIPAGYEGD